jgi:ABC-type sugar transport system permease subunit
MKEQISIVQIIQLMLAPGLMISACGLLLLGMNNKYSLVVNRIRLLNEERRKFFSKAGEREFNYEENVRLESISKQIDGLVSRVGLVKNAVLYYTVAVALFVITSLLIGLLYFYEVHSLNIFVTFLFLCGMISVLIGVVFAARETKKGFDIIKLEVKIDE